MKAAGKIYILVSDMAIGGAERVMLALASCISETREVELICLKSGGALLKELPADIPVRLLSTHAVGSVMLTIRGFMGVLKVMRSSQSATLMSTGTGTNLLACAARLLAPKGAKLVMREACSSKNSDSRILAFLKRLLYPLADGMIGVSDGVAGELKRLATKRQLVVSIPNPVDVKKLQLLANAQDEVLSRFPHSYLLTVGRLVPQKNTALLIDAFAEVANDIPEHLVIIGGGPLDSDLRRKVARLGLESRIHLLGELANPHPWYRRASLFVLSSDSEGYPNALLEALAHGLRVVATDCDFGPRQILDWGRFGALVEVGDSHGLSKAILNALRDVMVASKWGHGPFSVKFIAGRYLAFIDSFQND